MFAFVNAAATRLSCKSSFLLSSSTRTFVTQIGSFRSTTQPKRQSRSLLRMNMEDDDQQVRDSPVSYDDTKLFVGNLAWATTEESLKEAFAPYGQVVDARVITDRFTGRSRGFGFVEYDAASEANEALEAMNGADIDGRNVRVDRAASRQRQFRRRNDDYY